MDARILVVDNNRINAEILCECLEKLGSETVVCKDGEECLSEVAKGNISMIFLEVVLPDISGLEVIIAIRQKYDSLELPVIMLSTLRDDKTMARAIGLGANDFLYKPLDCKVTVARICNQVLAFKLYKKSLDKKKSETINSMIATYNHEINNSLSIAFAELHLARIDNDNLTLARVSNALKEISGVVRKIKDCRPGDIEETNYLLGEKMFELKKVPGFVPGTGRK